MTSLSSIHAYNLTVFHTCLCSKKGMDKVTRAIETYKQQQGAQRVQAEVARLIHEIDPQLIDTEKKLTGIRKIYHAIIRFFTDASSIRSLVTAFHNLNEEIRTANLISFDLETMPLPEAPIAPTLFESVPDPDLTLPPISPHSEIDNSDEDEVPYRPLDQAWTSTINRFKTNILNIS